MLVRSIVAEYLSRCERYLHKNEEHCAAASYRSESGSLETEVYFVRVRVRCVATCKVILDSFNWGELEIIMLCLQLLYSCYLPSLNCGLFGRIAQEGRS